MKVFFKESDLMLLGSAHDVIEANGFSFIGIYDRIWTFSGKMRTKTYNVFKNDKNHIEYHCTNFNKYGSFTMVPVRDFTSLYRC